MMITKKEITDWLKQLQDNICKSIENADGKGVFSEDIWERSGGGGGRSRILTNGNIIEKGGVNFSAVFGDLPKNIVEALQVKSSDFFATGVSIVMHPYNPFVPIIHMNVRYFELGDGTKWFGGGIDLTPHYINSEDAAFFHQSLKDACDKHHKEYYPAFKKYADDYFFIKHRNETRGIGGIFFDRLIENEEFSIEDRFNFFKSVGEAFAPIYTHLMKKNHLLSFSEKNKEWQYIRRGRYVEFNLVYDKGTKFGLDTGGRIESILMSLPPMAAWPYNPNAEPESQEAQTLDLLKKDINWLKSN
jgi:coproporphyrinogen III oxidase